MNICFLQGIVVSDIKFEFILDSTDISIAIFKVKLVNESIVEVYAYDEVADFCYSKVKKGDVLYIEGSIIKKMKVHGRVIEKN